VVTEWDKYNNSKPAIRKVDDDKYELIWKVHDHVLCVSELTDDEFAEMIDHLMDMMSLPRGAHRQAEIIYHFPTMNARTKG